ncbi:MAG: RNA polymerase sigma factor [Kofleriaceae bacterium]
MIDFEDARADADDAALARRAADGDRTALDELVRRHQQWVFAVALRFTRNPDAAADLTQDALVRVITRISQFSGASGFRTWAWRIVLRCFLNGKRGHQEEAVGSFQDYEAFLERTGLEDPDPRTSPQEWELLGREVQVQCMLGMLLCLDREQRLVLILGAILGVPAPAAAPLLDWTPAQFRKRLERARADLASFMNENCGLVDPRNACRCPRKAAALVRQGLVDVQSMRFAGPTVRIARRAAAARSHTFDAWADDAAIQLFRCHPELAGPDAAAAIVALLDTSGFGPLARSRSPES